jgi:WD40 repeat protein
MFYSVLSWYYESQYAHTYVIAPDGRFIIRLNGYTDECELADLATSQTRSLKKIVPQYDISIDSNGKTLCWIEYDYDQKNWEGSYGVKMMDLESGDISIGPSGQKVSWTPSGNALLCLDYDSADTNTVTRIMVVDPASSNRVVAKAEMNVALPHWSSYGDIAFSPDGSHFAMSMQGWIGNQWHRTNILWSLPDLTLVASWTNTPEIMIPGLDNQIFMGQSSGAVELMVVDDETKGLKLKRSYTNLLFDTQTYSPSPSGVEIAWTGFNRLPESDLVIFNPATGEERLSIQVAEHNRYIDHIKWLKNGQEILCILDDGSLVFVDAASGETRQLPNPWKSHSSLWLWLSLSMATLYVLAATFLVRRSRQHITTKPDPIIDLEWSYLAIPGLMGLILIPLLLDDQLQTSHAGIGAFALTVAFGMVLLGVQLFYSRLLKNPLTFWMITTAMLCLSTILFIDF